MVKALMKLDSTRKDEKRKTSKKLESRNPWGYGNRIREEYDEIRESGAWKAASSCKNCTNFPINDNTAITYLIIL